MQDCGLWRLLDASKGFPGAASVRRRGMGSGVMTEDESEALPDEGRVGRCCCEARGRASRLPLELLPGFCLSPEVGRTRSTNLSFILSTKILWLNHALF